MNKHIVILLSFLLCYYAAQTQQIKFDSTFGKKGIGSLSLSGAPIGAGYKMYILEDGKILLAGVRMIFQPTSSSVPIVTKFNSDGTVDSSYGTNGIIFPTVNAVTGDGSSFGSDAYWAAATKDGKTAVTTYNGKDKSTYTSDSTYIVRYNVSGTPDVGLNGAGYISTHFPGYVPFIRGVKFQNDGKLLAIGKLIDTVSKNQYGPLIIRYLANGTPDPDFGTNGYIINQSSTQFSSLIPMLQTDGKILIGGEAFTYNGHNQLAYLMRFKPNGQADSTYGTNGIAQFAIKQFTDANDFFLDTLTNNTYYKQQVISTKDTITIRRFDSNGSPDYTFGTNGRKDIYLNSTISSYNSFIIQPDSKIIVDGVDNSNGNRHFFIRFTINGMLDSTFGINGIDTSRLIASYPSSYRTFYSYGSTLQSDGKILLCGLSIDSENVSISKYDIACARFLLQSQSNNNYTTIGNGNWNDPTIWKGGVIPPINATVTVLHNVIVTADATCYSVNIINPGTISINTGIHFTITH